MQRGLSHKAIKWELSSEASFSQLDVAIFYNCEIFDIFTPPSSKQNLDPVIAK